MESAAPLDTRTFAGFVMSILTSLNRSRITYAVTGALSLSSPLESLSVRFCLTWTLSKGR